MKTTYQIENFKGEFNPEFMNAPFFRMSDENGYFFESVADHSLLINKQLINGFTSNKYSQNLIKFAALNQLAIVSKKGINGEFEIPNYSQGKLCKIYEELQSSLGLMWNE